MNEARAHHTATLLADGRVLVAGGYFATALQTAELYDPATGTWSYTGNLVHPQQDQSAVRLADGRVLIAGGTFYQGCCPRATNLAQIYDPATRTWTQTGSMNARRDSVTLRLLPDDRVMAAAGTIDSVKALATAEIYDPTTGVWSPTGSLSTGTFSQIDASLPDGRVLVATGDNANEYALRDAEIFDPITQTWSRTGRLATGRKFAGAASLADGRVLVAGGVSTAGNSLKSSELYVPARGRWATAGFLNHPRLGPKLVRLNDAASWRPAVPPKSGSPWPSPIFTILRSIAGRNCLR